VRENPRTVILNLDRVLILAANIIAVANSQQPSNTAADFPECNGDAKGD
jgi:hypothetical protein